MRKWAAALAAGILVAGVATGVSSASAAFPVAARAQAPTGFGSNWTVYHQDPLGSGADPSGTNLSGARQAWTTSVNGQLYGEPLVDNGRVFVATENNVVYALAANTGGVLWSTPLASPVPSRDLPCGNISPWVGITSTPVIDPALNEIFVVADEAAAGNNASHHLIGLDLSTGEVRLDQPVDPSGSHPLYQLQRPGLALDAGQVIIGFGGNDGDCETSTNPYHGWLVAVPEGGGPPRTFEVASNPGDSQGAIWMGGAAPIVDGTGDIWVATGNSAFTSPSQPHFAYDYSDGVIKLNSSLVPQQFFAPSDWFDDNAADRDLGSSSPALMADDLAFQAGKSQTAYDMSQSALGGVGGQLKQLDNYCGGNVDGGSAVMPDSTGAVVYSPCEQGVEATQVNQGSSASPYAISELWQPSVSGGGAPGGPPIVASGLVWTIGNGNLYGLDRGSGQAVQTLPLGSEATDFPTPSVADGLLLAPTADAVVAFEGPDGLPPPPPPPSFRIYPGSAGDVSVGADGAAWVVGTNPEPAGFGIYRWFGSAWGAAPGAAVTIAVDSAGNPWVTNSANRIYHWDGSGWNLYPGGARDIAVGARGGLWVIGTNPEPDGYGIWHWNGRVWTPMPGAGVSVAVDAAGNAWVTNSLGQIFHWNGQAWALYPGGARDIAIGADGVLWVVGTNPLSGGHGIWRFNGSGWDPVDVGAVTIAVDPSGNPWLTNSDGQILSE